MPRKPPTRLGVESLECRWNLSTLDPLGWHQSGLVPYPSELELLRRNCAVVLNDQPDTRAGSIITYEAFWAEEVALARDPVDGPQGSGSDLIKIDLGELMATDPTRAPDGNQLAV